GPAPSGVSQVDPSPLVEPVEVSSHTSGPVEGGDPTRAATVTPRRFARLAVPPGFPPRPSSPLLQPVAVDSGAAGGGTTGGAGSGGAECPMGTGGTRGTGAGGPGASRLRVGGAGTAGAVGAGTAGAGGSATGGTRVASAGGTGARRQENLSPERLCEWAVQWGSPGGEASRARTTLAGGAGTLGAVGGIGGATAVGAALGSPGSRRQESLSPERLCAGAGVPGTGDTGTARGTGGVGAAAGPGGAGPGGVSAGVPGTGDTGAAGGTGGAGAAGGTGGTCPGGAITGVPGVGRAGGTGTGDGADTGGTRVSGASRQESLLPLQLREWAVRWGSPGGGAGGTGSGGAVATGAGDRSTEQSTFLSVTSSRESCSSVVILVLLHVAAQCDYELHSLDFSLTFLQGSLHEEIWLRRPPGFTGSFPAGTQWSLRWPVYGLRQAPREWQDTLRTTLAALGFAPSTADPSLFLRTDTTLPPFYVLVYVDDLAFATADTEAVAHVMSELQKRHTCTNLGELTSYLGLRITRDRAQCTITLTQSHMVQQVLQRFGFTHFSPLSTPLPTGHSLSARPSDESVEPSGPYPELVGCLIYLMTCTRPDLAYPLSLLTRYVAPGRHRKVHWDAAKRVLRYLCSTSGMGLMLGGRARVVLTGHADASSVDDLAAQRSSQGYTFSLGSGSFSWRSTRSSSVLNSSCEAEIYAGAMAAQELRWLTYLLTDLGEAPRSPPVLYVDNKAMLALCQEHRLEHRTKHIAVSYFLARELQQRGQLRLAYVASQANTVDVFTMALQPCDHQRFCTVLGLVPTVPHLLSS
ncbi:unnamed protein product, partial [Closterium sp. NIES-54]